MMKQSIRETADILHPQTSPEGTWPQGHRPSQWWRLYKKIRSFCRQRRSYVEEMRCRFVWKDIENAECQQIVGQIPNH